MKPGPFKYVKVENLQQAVKAITSENARILAGGMSLIPLLKLRLAVCDTLIDISRVPELDLLVVDEAEIKIGATRTLVSLIEDELILAAEPAIAHILSHVGSPQIRNRATFVGALCHADPASEALLLTLLFDGSVRLASAAGVRQMKVSKFVTAPLVNAAKEDEIVVDVSLPRIGGRTAFGFRCYAPRPGDYSVCAAVVFLARGSPGDEIRASVVVAGIDHLPVRLQLAERMLEKSCLSADAVEDALRLCERACVLSDVHGSVDYRMKLSASLLAGAIADAKSRLENG